MEWMQHGAAAATAVFGVWAVLQPRAVARLADLGVPSGRALAEVRVSLGAVFVGAGVGALVWPAGAVVLGAAYAAMALVRVVALGVDGDRSTGNVVSVVLEAVLAAMLLAPRLLTLSPP